MGQPCGLSLEFGHSHPAHPAIRSCVGGTALWAVSRGQSSSEVGIRGRSVLCQLVVGLLHPAQAFGLPTG